MKVIADSQVKPSKKRKLIASSDKKTNLKESKKDSFKEKRIKLQKKENVQKKKQNLNSSNRKSSLDQSEQQQSDSFSSSQSKTNGEASPKKKNLEGEYFEEQTEKNKKGKNTRESINNKVTKEIDMTKNEKQSKETPVKSNNKSSLGKISSSKKNILLQSNDQTTAEMSSFPENPIGSPQKFSNILDSEIKEEKSNKKSSLKESEENFLRQDSELEINKNSSSKTPFDRGSFAATKLSQNNRNVEEEKDKSISKRSSSNKELAKKRKNELNSKKKSKSKKHVLKKKGKALVLEEINNSKLPNNLQVSQTTPKWGEIEFGDHKLSNPNLANQQPNSTHNEEIKEIDEKIKEKSTKRKISSNKNLNLSKEPIISENKNEKLKYFDSFRKISSQDPIQEETTNKNIENAPDQIPSAISAEIGELEQDNKGGDSLIPTSRILHEKQEHVTQSNKTTNRNEEDFQKNIQNPEDSLKKNLKTSTKKNKQKIESSINKNKQNPGPSSKNNKQKLEASSKINKQKIEAPSKINKQNPAASPNKKKQKLISVPKEPQTEKEKKEFNSPSEKKNNDQPIREQPLQAQIQKQMSNSKKKMMKRNINKSTYSDTKLIGENNKKLNFSGSTSEIISSSQKSYQSLSKSARNKKPTSTNTFSNVFETIEERTRAHKIPSSQNLKKVRELAKASTTQLRMQTRSLFKFEKQPKSEKKNTRQESMYNFEKQKGKVIQEEDNKNFLKKKQPEISEKKMEPGSSQLQSDPTKDFKLLENFSEVKEIKKSNNPKSTKNSKREPVRLKRDPKIEQKSKIVLKEKSGDKPKLNESLNQKQSNKRLGKKLKEKSRTDSKKNNINNLKKDKIETQNKALSKKSKMSKKRRESQVRTEKPKPLFQNEFNGNKNLKNRSFKSYNDIKKDLILIIKVLLQKNLLKVQFVLL